MAFQVQPATYADLDTLADVIVRAHIRDELIPMMLGDVTHAEQVEWYADSLRKVWEEDKGARYYKAVEMDSQKIVAMARFHYPVSMTAEERLRAESNSFGPLPGRSNVKFCQEFFETLEVYEARHLDRHNAYFVNFLATLPDYHRKGLGKLLIDVCLKDAKDAQAETFLIATPTGSGLYRKLGFEEIDRINWDLSPHGGSGTVSWPCMTKRPTSTAKGSITGPSVVEAKMLRAA